MLPIVIIDSQEICSSADLTAKSEQFTGTPKYIEHEAGQTQHLPRGFLQIKSKDKITILMPTMQLLINGEKKAQKLMTKKSITHLECIPKIKKAYIF